ncbi:MULTISPECIES: hypothetical protein [unclassified Streptomyces]|uniref:hypothetical protein n=1 Tax=unclassified Streptomyces TaxID=2593676 RepID=UPI0033F33CD2
MNVYEPGGSLEEVARIYRTEALDLKYGSPARKAAEAMAVWCDEAVANRTPDHHHATLITKCYYTLDWIRRHGYHAAVTGAGIGPGGVSIIMQRNDETVVANIPAHLHWDGQRITVDPPGRRA